METYKEILNYIIYTMLTGILPLLTAYFVLLIRKKINETQSNIDRNKLEQIGIDADILNKYITLVENAVYKAVMETNQVYVDDLKKTGTFSAELQKEALQKSINRAKEIMGSETRTLIETAFGDVDLYLTSSIESLIKTQKLSTATA